MKAQKLVTFKRDKLVKKLNQKALNIVNDIIDESAKEEKLLFTYDVEDWDDYHVSSFNESFNSLKRRRRQFYLGRITMLHEFVAEFDVYINKRAHGFLSHMSQLETNNEIL